MPDQATSSAEQGSAVTEASTPALTNTEHVLSAQGLSEISDSELMGEDSSTSESQSAPSESSVQEPETETTSSSTNEEELKPSAESNDEKPDVVKPLKGYVPTAALHEVRGENKYLKEQIAQLQAQLQSKPAVETKPAEPEPSPFDGFIELSDTEFKALAEDSPSDALLYTKQLLQFQDYKREQAQKAKESEEQQVYLDNIFTEASKAMEEVVPGIFDESSPAAEELKTFAESIGFSDDMFYLTNPATQVILPGESEPLLLGDQAVQILRLLATSRSRINAKSEVANVEQIKASLRAEIEAEVLQKLKSTQGYRSLSDVPAASQITLPRTVGKVLTDIEFSRLSEKEQDLYLAGE